MSQLLADTKPRRADARRNRERLLEIAASVFADKGVSASLEDIARQAGVGVGTLYRHFPTREHLVEVVYRREVQALCDAADDLVAKHPPDMALEAWLQRFVGYVAAKRGMAASLRLLSAAKSDVFAQTSLLMPHALQRLLDAGAAAGSIRDDVTSADILHALSGIFSAPDTPDWQARSRRVVSLLMDGLRWRRK